MWDRTIGNGLMVLNLIFFVYYTFWIMVSPFIDTHHFTQVVFPPREYGLVIPAVIISLFFLVALGSAAVVFIVSGGGGGVTGAVKNTPLVMQLPAGVGATGNATTPQPAVGSASNNFPASQGTFVGSVASQVRGTPKDASGQFASANLSLPRGGVQSSKPDSASNSSPMDADGEAEGSDSGCSTGGVVGATPSGVATGVTASGGGGSTGGNPRGSKRKPRNRQFVG
jgi:dolichyl-phosphate mannosyltransferase polypeptide 2 regulatory subunit